MPKIPTRPNDDGSPKSFKDNEIEDSPKINQEQLNNAKIFSSREEYAKTLKMGLRFMELGVAWGYYSELIAEVNKPASIDLVDYFNIDLKCWSWRKFGECKCEPIKHTMDYVPKNHHRYIIDKFAKYPNVSTHKGDATYILRTLKKDFDYIYIDITNDRPTTSSALELSSKLVPVGGIIGLNDYLIYDGVIEDKPYGTFQTVNQFMYRNKNWSVDALALHNLGFYDIYLKRNA